MMRTMALILLSLALACSGGGPSGGPGDAAPPADGPATCPRDAGADAVAPGLVKTSKTGAFQVTLVAASPLPPVVGTNTWTIQLKDQAGALLSNAPILVTVVMPHNGHGSTTPVQVTPQADAGAYKLTPIDLQEAGLWAVTLDIRPNAHPEDQVTFTTCVSGP